MSIIRRAIISFLAGLIVLSFSPTLVNAQGDMCQPPQGWEATYTVQRRDNLYRIAQGFNVSLDEMANANCISNPSILATGRVLSVPNPTDTHPQFIPINLILNNDNGQNGVLLGCGDSLVRVTTNRVASGEPTHDLRVALDDLLNPTGQNALAVGLVNDWANYHVRVKRVSLSSGVANVELEGDFLRPGHCADARLEGLLWHTVLMYPEIEEASITLNGNNLRALFDESDLVDQQARYSRSMTPDRCPIPVGWYPYTIQRGDNLYRISQSFDSTIGFISTRNCIENPSVIVVGTVIYTPLEMPVPAAG